MSNLLQTVIPAAVTFLVGLSGDPGGQLGRGAGGASESPRYLLGDRQHLVGAARDGANWHARINAGVPRKRCQAAP
jgi:hypothetical protein